MGPNTGQSGVIILDEIRDAWNAIPEKILPFVGELTEDKVRELQGDASQSYLETSGQNRINQLAPGEKFVPIMGEESLVKLARTRVLASLASEANRLMNLSRGNHDGKESVYLGVYREIAGEMTGHRLERK